jgi:hypothetical protein
VPDGQGDAPGRECGARLEESTSPGRKLFAKNDFFSKNVSRYEDADFGSLKHWFADNWRK